ncbi:hypothetical protein HPB47_016301, partial [Ixodes persulcatus]
TEATWDLNTSPKPGFRELTHLGSLDKLKNSLGAAKLVYRWRRCCSTYEKVKVEKDVEKIERETRDQAKSSVWMRHRFRRPLEEVLQGDALLARGLGCERVRVPYHAGTAIQWRTSR